MWTSLSCSKVFTPQLLMHRVSFWSISECLNLLVLHESLNCPQCEKMDLKIIQSLLERVYYAKDSGKLKNLQDLEDFYEEKCSFELFRINKGLMNNHNHTQYKEPRT